MFDDVQKWFVTKFWKPLLSRYLSKPRTTRLNGFDLWIKPGVFHPRFFFSSRFLFEFVEQLDLKEKKFLEVGCGSGFISLGAARKDARVTCCDLNPDAVECSLINFRNNIKNAGEFHCMESDVFSNLSPEPFDVIVINPPYFFEEVSAPSQLAWNCGRNGEYFISLFSGMTKYMHQGTKIYMILADNCELERIQEISRRYDFCLEYLVTRKIRWEHNYIFGISAARPADSLVQA